MSFNDNNFSAGVLNINDVRIPLLRIFLKTRLKRENSRIKPLPTVYLETLVPKQIL